MEVKIQKVSGSPKATAGRKEDRNMTTIEYEGKALTLDYDAQLDNYGDGAFDKEKRC